MEYRWYYNGNYGGMVLIQLEKPKNAKVRDEYVSAVLSKTCLLPIISQLALVLFSN